MAFVQILGTRIRTSVCVRLVSIHRRFVKEFMIGWIDKVSFCSGDINLNLFLIRRVLIDSLYLGMYPTCSFGGLKELHGKSQIMDSL